MFYNRVATYLIIGINKKTKIEKFLIFINLQLNLHWLKKNYMTLVLDTI